MTAPVRAARGWLDEIEESFAGKQRMDEVLGSLRELKKQEEVWYRLYDNAKQFTVPRLTT